MTPPSVRRPTLAVRQQRSAFAATETAASLAKSRRNGRPVTRREMGTEAALNVTLHLGRSEGQFSGRIFGPMRSREG